MSLFQAIVIEKYVSELNKTELETAWQVYSQCFLNLSKQDNIRLSKEEQYQEGFLRDLFVDVFGYTLNPNPNYDLTTEFKNQTGSKKADGAILKDGHAVGVIELKGMNTTDLSKIESQAFGYKNNQPKCRYVITSNFQKLRLYIDNAVEFIEFNLFTLSQEDFARLYLLLQRDSIMSDLPATIKSASLSQEEAITKQLYKDYSVFKRELFNDLTTNNPSIDNLVLFQKSQKLLDRLLFIFFAEDSHLLPANFAKGIISEWQQLKALKMTVPLYDRIKAYFGYLDKGHKDEHSEIFAYNGGLFSSDELLDSIIISDDILFRHVQILSEYDFGSEVDVNILGHIFENSLTELDEVKAQLEGTAVDKSQTKRKKDGVFYTPKYITKYIVENTVGKLCIDKKAELAINDEEYQQEILINKDGTKKKKSAKQIATEAAALEKLHSYREWLLAITICDPACGSGAFLNEALNFLIAEHEYIVELETKLFGSGLPYADIENSILENNLFGVDINEESVEIAKLSLWLRTAQPRRKLNNLNDNIQCGNSLIDDPEVAGDKAFNWQTAFPQVFANGGFDVVIGNPPYVSHERVQNTEFLKKNYESYQSFADLFCYFYEIGFNILKDNGLLSYITSNSFLKADYGSPLRSLIYSQGSVEQIINIEDAQIFSDAIVNSVILIFRNSKAMNSKTLVVNSKYNADTDFLKFISDNGFFYQHLDLNTPSWTLIRPEYLAIVKKLKASNPTLEDLQTKIRLGIATGSNEAFLIDEQKKNELIKNDPKSAELIQPVLRGRDIYRYHYELPNQYIILSKNGIDIKKNYQGIYDHLESFGTKFKSRGAKGEHWTNLRACSFFEDFKKEKIIWIELTDSGRFSLCSNEIYLLNSAYFLLPPKGYSSGYLLAILNSTAMQFYLKQIANTSGVGTFRYFNIYVKEFPIPEAQETIQTNFSQKADLMLSLNEQLQTLTSRFTRTLQRKFEIDKLSKKLENWYELTYAEFIKELTKKKIKMSLGDEAEWEEYFLAEQTKAQQLLAEIERTDSEIDQMVYKLYELTADEIAIIESLSQTLCNCL